MMVDISLQLETLALDGFDGPQRLCAQGERKPCLPQSPQVCKSRSELIVKGAPACMSLSIHSCAKLQAASIAFCLLLWSYQHALHWTMARLGKFAYRCRSGMCDSWFHVYVVGSFVKELHVLFAISFGDISNIDPWGRQDQLICEPCALLWPLPVLQYFEYLRCHICVFLLVK